MVPDLLSSIIFTNIVILFYCIVIAVFINSRNQVGTQNREIWRSCLFKRDTSEEKNMRLEKLTNFNELQQDRNQIKTLALQSSWIVYVHHLTTLAANGTKYSGFFFFWLYSEHQMVVNSNKFPTTLVDLPLS